MRASWPIGMRGKTQPTTIYRRGRRRMWSKKWSKFTGICGRIALKCLISMSRDASRQAQNGGETGIRTLGTRKGSTVFETVFGLFGCAEVPILLASKRSRGAKLASSAGQGGIVGRHSASSLPSRWEVMRGRTISLMAGDPSPGSSTACCGWLCSTGRWPTGAPCNRQRHGRWRLRHAQVPRCDCRSRCLCRHPGTEEQSSGRPLLLEPWRATRPSGVQVSRPHPAAKIEWIPPPEPLRDENALCETVGPEAHGEGL